MTAWSMPPEWHTHDRTWMGFPTDNYVGSTSEQTVGAWSAVANTIVDFESVTMLVNPEDRDRAQRALDGRVEIRDCALDDCWLRDIGPTFVIGDDGELGAVTWRFNGWGAQEWARWEHDSEVGHQVAGWAGATRIESTIVNEGGGIAVDGAGTGLVTETVQLDSGRNPGLDRAAIEAEIGPRLGVHRFVWLDRGLAGDYFEFGTRGHVDLVAAFVGPGACVVHRQGDPRHPDHDFSAAVAEMLSDGGIEVTTIDAPAGLDHDGRPVDWSYINFYVGNGFVLMPTFADPEHDEAAAETLSKLFPRRELRTVDGRPLFACGGGVHCITQQQPARRRGGGDKNRQEARDA